jgi:hypothetical protein
MTTTLTEMDDETVLHEIDLGLVSLCLLVDDAFERFDGDVFLVIEELTKAILLNSNHKQAAGFCAFVVMRYRGYI